MKIRLQPRFFCRLTSLAALASLANLPFDVLTRLRLDYDSLRALKDDIILVMPSAYGPDGPYRDRPGFDGVAQATRFHVEGGSVTPT